MTEKELKELNFKRIMDELCKLPGGYKYYGGCSVQVCFPLKSGGELRFMIVDDDAIEDGDSTCIIDIYDGLLPAMISGPSISTGKEAK